MAQEHPQREDLDVRVFNRNSTFGGTLDDVDRMLDQLSAALSNDWTPSPVARLSLVDADALLQALDEGGAPLPPIVHAPMVFEAPLPEVVAAAEPTTPVIAVEQVAPASTVAVVEAPAPPVETLEVSAPMFTDAPELGVAVLDLEPSLPVIENSAPVAVFDAPMLEVVIPAEAVTPPSNAESTAIELGADELDSLGDAVVQSLANDIAAPVPALASAEATLLDRPSVHDLPPVAPPLPEAPLVVEDEVMFIEEPRVRSPMIPRAAPVPRPTALRTPSRPSPEVRVAPPAAVATIDNDLGELNFEIEPDLGESQNAQPASSPRLTLTSTAPERARESIATPPARAPAPQRASEPSESLEFDLSEFMSEAKAPSVRPPPLLRAPPPVPMSKHSALPPIPRVSKPMPEPEPVELLDADDLEVVRSSSAPPSVAESSTPPPIVPDE